MKSNRQTVEDILMGDINRLKTLMENGDPPPELVRQLGIIRGDLQKAIILLNAREKE